MSLELAYFLISIVTNLIIVVGSIALVSYFLHYLLVIFLGEE